MPFGCAGSTRSQYLPGQPSRESRTRQRRSFETSKSMLLGQRRSPMLAPMFAVEDQAFRLGDLVEARDDYLGVDRLGHLAFEAGEHGLDAHVTLICEPADARVA